VSIEAPPELLQPRAHRGVGDAESALDAFGIASDSQEQLEQRAIFIGK
jgi:hypothetical protein